jgi:hypothetical protein
MKPNKSLKVTRDIHRTAYQFWSTSLALACCGGEMIGRAAFVFKPAARLFLELLWLPQMQLRLDFKYDTAFERLSSTA